MPFIKTPLKAEFKNASALDNKEFVDRALKELRGVLFIVRTGNDIIKADFVHTKRTTLPTEMKIGIHLEELK